MYKSVIAGYSRSPFTMARKGALIDTKPVNLLADVIKNLVSKSNVKKQDIEDIVVGCRPDPGCQHGTGEKIQDSADRRVLHN